MIVFFNLRIYWAGIAAIAGILFCCYAGIKAVGVGERKKAVIKKRISSRLGDGGSDRFTEIPVGGGRSIITDTQSFDARVDQALKSLPPSFLASLNDSSLQEKPGITPQLLVTNPTNAYTKICVKCSTMNATNSGFCFHCGQKLA
ncbi:MAG: hypothetical protein A2Y88_10950 [Chloroflexi bacterium RBG_13_48_10]|nr:MAG: hypothetical protein A2Y88_10950 [Chloroflexi bacterium RBG_13_48_10]